jgi:hypothetical protein
MSRQKQIQKKPSTTISGSRSHSFSSPGFAVQSKANNASAPIQHSGNLKNQLSRASRFGHSLSQMATVQSKAASGQNQTIQRQAVPEEEPEQMKFEQSIQRLEEPEEEPEQMKSEQSIQRLEEPEEEPEQMKSEQSIQRLEEPEEEPEQMKSEQSIQRQAVPEEEPEQMKSERSAIQRQAAPAVSSGSGNSIPGAVRAKMEKSFGTSFGDVNIHTNSTQAKSIGALAYTQGSNIHFAPGRYDPQSPAGQSLLGHELTHVVQQRAGRVPKPTQSKALPINADTALEKEADDMGAKAARGELVKMPGASGLSFGGELPM